MSDIRLIFNEDTGEFAGIDLSNTGDVTVMNAIIAGMGFLAQTIYGIPEAQKDPEAHFQAINDGIRQIYANISLDKEVSEIEAEFSKNRGIYRIFDKGDDNG